MPLPLFFTDQPVAGNQTISLDEPTARHIVQVLRMKSGEKLELTDGKGNLYLALLLETHKKKAVVQVERTSLQPATAAPMAVAVSLVKNNSRFEWFLEKATELGIAAIYPLLCDRTEKQHFRADRMQNILISALLQSRQSRLPLLHEPLPYADALTLFDQEQKFIAHCEEENKQAFSSLLDKNRSAVIMIGPEGDFSRKEIDAARERQFVPVALGATRLRTETAALAAAVVMKL